MRWQTMQMLAIVAAVALITAPARADWVPSDGHKMHFPQLPDPSGWDVDITTNWVYDDWQCSATGPVQDIHFWVSWQGDNIGPIAQVMVEIRSDVPAGQGLPYSHPDGILWQHSFLPGEFIVGTPLSGSQGWINPNFTQPQWNRPDHNQFFQVNIPTIIDPFPQQEGTIYWLGLHIIPQVTGPKAGWKTSLNHFNDDAAYYYGGQWRELIDPTSGQSLDMAFVITPEPSSLVLLGGGLLLLARRRG